MTARLALTPSLWSLTPLGPFANFTQGKGGEDFVHPVEDGPQPDQGDQRQVSGDQCGVAGLGQLLEGVLADGVEQVVARSAVWE
jgi:hypothetical protein